MKITAEPRSDQWNADDLIGGPRTFTVAGVKVGTAEQKYDITLVEGGGRCWRPPLTVLRLLIAAWGDEAATWTGRRVTLYRDPAVRFGSDAVGGIRVSHMSDLPGGKRLTVKLTASRGKREAHTVEPLPDAEPTVPPLRFDSELGIELFALMDQHGITERLDFVGDVVGRPIHTGADVTTADAEAAITALRDLQTIEDPTDDTEETDA